MSADKIEAKMSLFSSQRPASPVKVIIEGAEWIYELELEPCNIEIGLAGDSVTHMKPVKALITGDIHTNIRAKRGVKEEKTNDTIR